MSPLGRRCSVIGCRCWRCTRRPAYRIRRRRCRGRRTDAPPASRRSEGVRGAVAPLPRRTVSTESTVSRAGNGDAAPLLSAISSDEPGMALAARSVSEHVRTGSLWTWRGTPQRAGWEQRRLIGSGGFRGRLAWRQAGAYAVGQKPRWQGRTGGRAGASHLLFGRGFRERAARRLAGALPLSCDLSKCPGGVARGEPCAALRTIRLRYSANRGSGAFASIADAASPIVPLDYRSQSWSWKRRRGCRRRAGQWAPRPLIPLPSRGWIPHAVRRSPRQRNRHECYARGAPSAIGP